MSRAQVHFFLFFFFCFFFYLSIRPNIYYLQTTHYQCTPPLETQEQQPTKSNAFSSPFSTPHHAFTTPNPITTTRPITTIQDPQKAVEGPQQLMQVNKSPQLATACSRAPPPILDLPSCIYGPQHIPISPISSMPGLFCHPHTWKHLYEQLYAHFLFHFALKMCVPHTCVFYIYSFIYSFTASKCMYDCSYMRFLHFYFSNSLFLGSIK